MGKRGPKRNEELHEAIRVLKDKQLWGWSKIAKAFGVQRQTVYKLYSRGRKTVYPQD